MAGYDISRRDMLLGAAALGAGGAAAMLGASAAVAAPRTPSATDADKWKGTKFRAYVRHDSTASVQELRLLRPGPAGAWTNRGKTIHSAQYGGVDAMKDLPRFCVLIERGLYRADKLASDTWDLAHARDVFTAAANRSVISAHVVFD